MILSEDFITMIISYTGIKLSNAHFSLAAHGLLSLMFLYALARVVFAVSLAGFGQRA